MNELKFKASSDRMIAINLCNVEEITLHESIDFIELYYLSNRIIYIALDEKDKSSNSNYYYVDKNVFDAITHQLFHPNLLAFGN